MSSIISAGGRWYAGHKFHFFVLGAVFISAAFFRFWAAPLSAGPDVAQFWAFAKVFEDHGIDFYKYAGGTDSFVPFWGWGFVYPPIWLLILRLSLLAAPLSVASAQIIDASWRLAMKTPIISADLAIGGLIYWAVPGSKLKKLLFASLWLFHPTAWYESAVFGQFDAIAAAFLLASVIMFERRNDRLAFLFAGLALMTKQHTFLPIVLMLAVSAWHMSKLRFLSNCSILLGVVALLSIPFLLTGNFHAYADSLFLPGWSPDYQEPLVYAFSGSSSLLTYLHNVFGWETSGLLNFNMPVLGVATLAAIVLSRFRPITATQAALVGSLLFIGISYQVHYQYVIIYIPIAILAASKANWKLEKAVTLGLAILPAIWLWLFDVSFWFRYLQPVHPGVMTIFDRIGWVTHVPDYAYVSFALILMSFSLAYAVFTFLWWHGKGQKAIPAPAAMSACGRRQRKWGIV